MFSLGSPHRGDSNEYTQYTIFNTKGGWSGGAKVLSKLSVPGRPTNLDYSRARACCACSRCGWGLFGIFSLICPFSPLSPSLWETARYRLIYCLKGPLNPKQPTNQPNQYKREKISLNYPKSADIGFFKGTQERV